MSLVAFCTSSVQEKWAGIRGTAFRAETLPVKPNCSKHLYFYKLCPFIFQKIRVKEYFTKFWLDALEDLTLFYK